MGNILEIENLHTYFKTKNNVIKAVNGVSLSVKKGETLGVIGESGSGKSQTAMSVLKLFEKNQSIQNGSIIFDGNVISGYSDEDMRKIRGNEISMIFQEPMTSLNPVLNIERQITEPLLLHSGMNKLQARQFAEQLLNDVKIPNAKQMAKRYPHELSGGMRQRVMIAIALACRPKLLIADEPTTALDVTIQAQILHLMNELKKQHNTSILFITHDLAVIRQMANTVAVMYCGQVVELAPVSSIFNVNEQYSHPYTRALLKSMPAYAAKNSTRLLTIPGNVPHPLNLPSGCKFAQRCAFANLQCTHSEPELVQVSANHSVRCFYPDDTRCEHE